MPVHAHHRLDGGACPATRSVGHEEDGVPVVLAAGMLLGKVLLRLLDEIVLIRAGDRLAARTVQVGLHPSTIPQPRCEGMDLYDVMRTTGAVREFTDDPLPDEVLERILDNARFAPSGGNRQGAHVIVVRDRARPARRSSSSA